VPDVAVNKGVKGGGAILNNNNKETERESIKAHVSV
jgi:hypothetical protein